MVAWKEGMGSVVGCDMVNERNVFASRPNPRTGVQRFRHEQRLASPSGRGDIGPMPPQETVFVNARPVTVTTGATVHQALIAFDPAVAERAGKGEAAVTDGVGRPIDLSALLTGGAILRVIPSARAGAPTDPDIEE